MKSIAFFLVLCSFFIYSAANAQFLLPEAPSPKNPCKWTTRANGKIVECRGKPIVYIGFPTLITTLQSTRNIGTFFLKGVEELEGWGTPIIFNTQMRPAAGKYVLKWIDKYDSYSTLPKGQTKPCKYKGGASGKKKFKDLCAGNDSIEQKICMCIPGQYYTSKIKNGVPRLRKEIKKIGFRITLDGKTIKLGDIIEFEEGDIARLIVTEK